VKLSWVYNLEGNKSSNPADAFDDISTKVAATTLHLECYVNREVAKFKEEEERYRRQLGGVKIPAYVNEVNSCI
jgi:hypothetical protein